MDIEVTNADFPNLTIDEQCLRATFGVRIMRITINAEPHHIKTGPFNTACRLIERLCRVIRPADHVRIFYPYFFIGAEPAGIPRIRATVRYRWFRFSELAGVER